MVWTEYDLADAVLSACGENVCDLFSTTTQRKRLISPVLDGFQIIGLLGKGGINY